MDVIESVVRFNLRFEEGEVARLLWCDFDSGNDLIMVLGIILGTLDRRFEVMVEVR